jgi:RNA polymerase sigma-70 factor (ECF subfamily)
MLRDDAAAEDATQETFLRVLRHLKKAPDDREALTWIYRIATNHCLNVLRDARRRAREPDPVPGPAHPESALADRNFVEHALRRAPRKVSVVAWLHHVDGLAQGDVANVLGISRRTVVNRLSHFAKSLRRLADRR